ncbi:MAG: beta-glucosidase-like glycosyl hydrolase [Bacteroidetes bacterium]|nr:MAG: beta-glucosidase-like glycosyl hydrolase [Bacteroidota bacterium]
MSFPAYPAIPSTYSINRAFVDKSVECSRRGTFFAGNFKDLKSLRMRRNFFPVTNLFFLFFLIAARTVYSQVAPPFSQMQDTRWADSVFKSLTPDERIAQLFMVTAYSNKDAAHVKEISDLVKQQKIGGLMFLQGGPVRQANLTNKYQKLAKTPLLISIDGEWGLAMRLDSTVKYPKQMTLGAIENDSLIYRMGRDIAVQCKRMGIHVNFSPVADVNNNPMNPVIGVRSFGEDKLKVARKASLYMKGLQDGGVLANAKHFPGHGDTDSDSHKTLPVINHDQLRMDSLELYPFRELIAQGLGSMMVAHLFIPAYDTTKNTATTLSKAVVTDLLREKMKFSGLVFTDALNMKGVSQFYGPGELAVKTLVAGNDVLLCAEDVAKSILMIKEAIKAGKITQEEIDARCKKILLVKQWAGLNQYKPVKTKNLIQDLNQPSSDWLNRQLAEASVTLVQNNDNLLPLMRPDTLKIAAVSVGDKDECEFQRIAGLYAGCKFFGIDREGKKSEVDSLISRLKSFNCVLLAVNNTNIKPQDDFGIYGIPAQLIDTLKKRNVRVVVSVFASSYALNVISGIEKADAVLVGYENNVHAESVAAQIIFGGLESKGKLPVSTNGYKGGTGLSSGSPVRLSYTMPEAVGADRSKLALVDSFALQGIRQKAYPGCQVIAAKDGRVFYMKSFGSHTYDGKRKVKNTDIYDVASITKIMASTPAMMKMTEEKKIALDGKLADYLPMTVGTNKKNMVIREMLAHQAGLQDWIPFWKRTVDAGGNLRKDIYRKQFSDSFPFRVGPGIFISKNYRDSIYKQLLASPLGPHTYRYSDLGYYLLKKIIEDKSGVLLNDYVANTFYRPLGLPTMGYLPRLRFEPSRVPPTENDVTFRKQLVQADVHDQGAAMMGGIAGHAGVFSNANDIAVMMQLYLNKGTYGGVRYLDSSVVNEFTRIQYPDNENRRGLGFDKPEPDPKKDSPVTDKASLQSFGHMGFTGTMTWADPATGIVYVFLSNRVFPQAEDNKLAKIGTRGSILRTIYESIGK